MADHHLSTVWQAIQDAHASVRAALHNGEVIDGRLCSAMPAIRELADVCNAAVQHDSEAFQAALRELHDQPEAAAAFVHDVMDTSDAETVHDVMHQESSDAS